MYLLIFFQFLNKLYLTLVSRYVAYHGTMQRHLQEMIDGVCTNSVPLCNLFTKLLIQRLEDKEWQTIQLKRKGTPPKKEFVILPAVKERFCRKVFLRYLESRIAKESSDMAEVVQNVMDKMIKHSASIISFTTVKKRTKLTKKRKVEEEREGNNVLQEGQSPAKKARKRQPFSKWETV